MPACSIRNCRKFVQSCSPFKASTLTGKWKETLDGTRLYVVTSDMKRRGYHRYELVLFVYDGKKWYEASNLPLVHHLRRVEQMTYARPLPYRDMVRIDRVELGRFATHGMAHHPDMTRLLAVSV